MAEQDSVLTRRQVFKGAVTLASAWGLGTLGSGCSDSGELAAGLTDWAVQHSFPLDAALAGLFVAIESGYYKGEQLKVDVRPGGAGVDPVTAVVSGDANMGIHANAASLILAYAGGLPVKVVASQYKRSPNGFLSKAASGLTTIERHDGVTFGVLQSTVSVLNTIFEINSIHGPVSILPPDALLPALLEDRVDVILGFVSNYGVRMDLLGVPYQFIPFDDLGYRQEFYAYFVSAASADNDRARVDGFLAATKEGWVSTFADPSNAARATHTFVPESSAEVVARMAQMQESLMQPPTGSGLDLLQPDVDAWEATVDLLVRSGELSEPINVDELFVRD